MERVKSMTAGPSVHGGHAHLDLLLEVGSWKLQVFWGVQNLRQLGPIGWWCCINAMKGAGSVMV